ncbi:hypothetical protein [Embleya sp. NBC_00896]|uniref:hypothetical protein n=1 Tax=Embleya sp. NBC_00896 TaxID=2975961 RepID=UPI00386B9998|nr:hypothetical protein OG928_24960 [Embleya sp. NBC_00896]
MSDTEPNEDDAGGNDGISLSGGPVTNTGAIVAGGENRVTVRRTGAVRGPRDPGRGHPLANTGGLVSGAGQEVEIEDTGDVDPDGPAERAEEGEGTERAAGDERAVGDEGERSGPGRP